MSTKTIELTADVQEAVRQGKVGLAEMFESQANIVRRIGNALKTDPSIGETPEKICVTIKHLLADEIEKGMIATRTIEDACPPEWKNKARSEAGARGAAESAAKSRGKGDSGDTSGKIDALNERMSTIEGQLNSLKEIGREIVRSGKPDGDDIVMRVPKDKFAAFAEVVNG